MKKIITPSLRGSSATEAIQKSKLDCFVVSLLAMTVILIGTGCSSSVISDRSDTAPKVVLPLDGNIAGYHPTYKRFGEYFQDRFSGYHLGEDVEIVPEDLGLGEREEVSVRAIADGVVRFAGRQPGYGGVMVIAHEVGDDRVSALYGHLDIGSAAVKAGDRVRVGQFIANLGDGFTSETDGERQHLHFALYRGDGVRLTGYSSHADDVNDWINPQDFFREYGVAVPSGKGKTSYDALTDPQGKKVFKLTFNVPDDWDVEYVPSLQALNLYRVTGSGIARERSQIFIRFFDADRFLTLPTVNVLSTRELVVGTGKYEARQYVIKKKQGVSDFPGQPGWRNRRHTVTDFHNGTGRTRYYVVAANPDLATDIYERVLASMRILP